MTSQENQQSAGLCAQLVLDTNIFMHCKHLRELRWADVEPGAVAFELIVTREVVRELDRLKVVENSRKRRRAQNAIALIGSLRHSDGEIIISDGDPRVSLRLGDPTRPDWDALPGLDPVVADDRILAETLTIQSSSGRLVLITNDVGMMLNAKLLDIAFFEPPTDWMLPRELDQHERQVQELKRELARHQRFEPDIVVSVLGDGHEAVEAIDFDLVSVPALSAAQVERLTALVLSQHPPSDAKPGEKLPTEATPETGAELVLRMVQSLLLPTEFAVSHYRDVSYPTFAEEVGEYFSLLTENLIYRSRFKRVTARAANFGSVPADKVKLEIQPLGDFGVYGDTAKPPIQAFPIPPEPPAPPVAALPLLFRRKPQLLLPAGDPAPDPEGFYWKVMPRDCDYKECSLTCEQFRHGTMFDLNVYLFARTPSPSGALRIWASATNMPSCREMIFRVRVRERSVTLLELALEEGLPPDVLGLLKQVY